MAERPVAPAVMRHRIPPQSGAAWELARGDELRIIDPEGEQVADLIAFNRADAAEHLSPGRCIDYAATIYLTTGHALYSNRSNVLLSITGDTVGRHDILLTPCSSEMFRILYGIEDEHPSCFSNLVDALAPFGVAPDQIVGSLNVFMNVTVGGDGTVRVLPPRSRAGDWLAVRAEMDVIVGVTACSAELTNNGTFSPIDVEIRRAG